jgi:SAM-dependent MidA family methyltransferase
VIRWKLAMERALYGPAGFFVRERPADHFRTSAVASPLFADAIAEVVERVDRVLGRPASFDLVDVGAGRGELLAAVVARLPDRVRPVAVERAPRPPDLPSRIGWTPTLPDDIVGVLLATEWLDNVPVDIASLDDVPRYVLVDPAAGEESLGPPVAGEDAAWLAQWWPLAEPGDRAEIGLPRDAAWADAVSRLRAGLALTVDYGHVRASRPPWGTLSGFRYGREVRPTPDGSCDVTMHVAMDSLAAAVPGSRLLTQRAALRLDASRPPLPLASTDPAGYVRALSRASMAAELTDPAGLGGHWWLFSPRRCDFWSYREYAA